MDDQDAALRLAFSANRLLAGLSVAAVLAGLGVGLLVFVFATRARFGLARASLIASIVMILAGAGGALTFGMRSGDAATALQRLSDERVAAWTKDAETERAKTAAALQEAAAARERTAALTLEVADALKQWEQAKTQTATLEDQAAEARPPRPGGMPRTCAWSRNA
jgi:hypothetical protein